METRRVVTSPLSEARSCSGRVEKHMRRNHIRSLVVWLSPCLLVWLSPCLLVGPVCRGDFDDAIDAPMYKAPEVPMLRVVPVFPEGATPLWLKALERPEAEYRCQVAEAVAKAHERGAKGLEVTVAPLTAALDRPDQY